MRINKSHWSPYEFPYLILPDKKLENVEDLDVFREVDPIEEIRNHLDKEITDYSDNLRMYIR